jgi:signal transduction histidine kinase
VSALVNLLTNAAKYAADGKYVRLEARAEGREVVFTVRDRGPGIPDAERRKVFEPFYRSGSELTRERDGMGLGLALARAAASRHRGRLELATAEGPGAVFHLSVPAGKGRAA